MSFVRRGYNAMRPLVMALSAATAVSTSSFQIIAACSPVTPEPDIKPSSTISSSHTGSPQVSPLASASPECHSRVCSDKMKAFALAAKGTGDSKHHNTGHHHGIHHSDHPYIGVPHQTKTAHQSQCPLDKNELGQNTWSVLHTIAAYYPENPTEEEQQHAKALIVALSKLFPCSYCAVDFRKKIEEFPPE